MERWLNSPKGFCGCSKAVKYPHIAEGEEVLSYNKHLTSPSYEELTESIIKLKLELARYKLKCGEDFSVWHRG